MTAKVRAEELDGYAYMLERNATSHDQAIDYSRKHQSVDIAKAHGCLSELWKIHSQIEPKANGVLSGLGIRGSAVAMRKAAQFYKKADEEAIEKVERAAGGWVPKPPIMGAKDNPYAGYANAVESPERHLKPPKPGEVQDPSKLVSDFGDYLSPSGWVLKVIETLFGTDPLEWWAKEFVSGDWEIWLNCADAWKNVAGCLTDIAMNIKSATVWLDPHWDGVAADAAFAYFAKMATNIERVAKTARALHTLYVRFATEAYYYAKVICDTLKIVVDVVVTMGFAIFTSLPKIYTVIDAVGKGITLFRTMAQGYQAMMIRYGAELDQIPPMKPYALPTG